MAVGRNMTIGMEISTKGDGEFEDDHEEAVGLGVLYACIGIFSLA